MAERVDGTVAGDRRRVILYGRPDCGLCDHAAAVLERVARRVPLEIVYVDITADSALEARYELVIPVVELDDGSRLETEISEWYVLHLLGVHSDAPAGTLGGELT
jgi:thiol-disulfide isomerase/thioredoxin